MASLKKVTTGSNTSKASTRDTSSIATTPEKVFMRKSSAPAEVLRRHLLKNSPLSTRRRLLQERRDSASSNSSDSPLSSLRGSKENLPVIKDVEGLGKEDGIYKANDRKIARVLPMSPSFMTQAVDEGVCSTAFNKHNFKELKDPEIRREYHNTPECSKPHIGTPTSFDVKGVPTTPHTPYQMPNITDEDSCSIGVAVRVRPLSQR
jgi:hypothetical protein